MALAQPNPFGRVYPVSRTRDVISQQPRPLPFQKNMRGFGGQDPDLLKNAIADLQPLSEMTTVFIRPKVVPLEYLTGWETESEYDICTVNGQVLYTVVEETDFCIRCKCCGPMKPFNLYIKTPEGRPVIQLTRLLTCSSYLCSQFSQKLLVHFPPGRLVATVERSSQYMLPKFEVKNIYKENEFIIEGPYCTCSCCGEVDYEIFSADKSNVLGKVSKNWTGFFKEAFHKTEFFGIEFPVTLDINKKVSLLAAAFLIDYIYFDH